MTRKGTDAWLQALRDEESDAAEIIAEPEVPDGAEVADGLGTYWRAWSVLRFDRSYGVSGGESAIPFAVYDRYASRYGIESGAFETFLTLMTAMDDEYLAWAVDRAKEEEDRRKRERS